MKWTSNLLNHANLETPAFDISFREYLQRALAYSAIDGDKSHALRHTYANHLAMKGGRLNSCPRKGQPANTPRKRYLDWACLLKRVYGDEVLICPHCGNKRFIIVFIEDALVARKILDHLGLESTGPPRSKARFPVQSCLF